MGIINYRGWGNAQGWVKPQFFISPDIGNLFNTYNLPIVEVVSCDGESHGNDYCYTESGISINSGKYSGKD